MIEDNVFAHVNRPQLRALMVNATNQCIIAGRGMGKSEWLDAPRLYENCKQMPRSGGIFLGASYLAILNQTLPPVLKTWRSWGLRDDVDFWVRKMPPKNLGLDLPYWVPETTEHAIFVRIKNKLSVIHMVGQDRKGSSNSKSVDWIVIPEAKFVNFEMLEQETMQTNRGNERYFGFSHLHHGISLSTDMPNDPAVLKKLLKYEELYKEEGNLEKIELILAAQIEINNELKRNTPNLKKIGKYYKYLSQLREKTTFFAEATTLHNAEVLGTDYVKKLKQLLPDFVYRLSVLNIRPQQVEYGFYANLNARHFTYATNFSFTDQFNIGEVPDDCRKDADILADEPLILSADYGGKINCLTVGQIQGHTCRYLKEFYVLHPEVLIDLARQYFEYYRYRSNKDVIMVYDATALQINSTSPRPPIDVFVDELEKFGFNVMRHFLGAVPDPYQRYLLWSYGLKGNNPAVLNPTFNADNCKFLKISMEQAATKEDEKGLRKDKRHEKKTHEEYDQREAPHFSDAADNLYWYANDQWRQIHNFSAGIIM